MEISLAELLSCEFFHNSRLLAGEKGLDKVVSHVTTLDSPDAYQYFRGNEFVITTGYFFINDADYQKSLIEKLAERGVAGIGITLRYFNNELPAMIQAEADRLDVPVISMPNETYYSDIYEFITANLVSKTTREIKLFNDVYKEIGDSVYNEGFLGISQAIYKWTGLKTVIEINGKIYAYPEDGLPEDFLLHEADWKKKIFFSSTHSNIECFSWEREEISQEWISSAILYNGKEAGKILLLKNSPIEYISRDTCQLLDYANLACSLEVKRVKTIAGFQRKYKADFLRRLAFEGLSADEIQTRAGLMDYCLPPKGAVLLIRGVDEQRLDNLVGEIFSEHTLCGMIEDDLAIAYVDCRKNYEDKISRLYAGIKEADPERDVIIGVGSGSELERISRSCESAKSALEIGAYLKKEPGVYYFENLGVYKLLRVADIQEEVQGFYDKHLKPLESQGENNFLNYIKTIECYIKNAYCFTETAEELHVHANTVRYRIGIIEKLCQINFKDADDRLNMEITFKTLPFLDNNTR